jgi:molecular chaperone Hsp33
LKYGDIAKDLAHYYVTSEQIPTAVNLGIQFDKQGNVVGAGGLLLQALPAAEDTLVAEIETLVPAMPSLGTYFADSGEPAELLAAHFGKFNPKILKEKRIEFMCHCSIHRIRNLLALLPVDELADLSQNGPFPVEIRCHFCNTPYHFDREAIDSIYGMRRSNN